MNYNIGFGRNIWPSVEVEGEFARESAIVKVIGGRPAPGRDVDLDDVAVALVPEPGNPHDKNAIAVQALGQTIGYLSRGDAVRYQRPIYRIAASGSTAMASGRIWASTDAWGGQKKFRSRVSLALPEPEMMLPLNDPPEGEYNLIPWGGGIQVTKEEDHLDVLFHHVPPTGEGLLFVTLHKEVKTLKNGAEKPFVEVRLDGQRVGELTPVTSAHFLPTVAHLEGSGEIPTALAKITGSAVAVQLVLQAAKAPEIPNQWFASSPNQVPKLLPWSEDHVPPATPVRQKKTAAPAAAPARPKRTATTVRAVTAKPPAAAHEASPAVLPAAQPIQTGNPTTGAMGRAVRLGLSMTLAVFGSLATLGFVGAGFNMMGNNFGGAIVALVFGAAIGWGTWLVIRYGRTGSFRKAKTGDRGRERGEELQEP